MKPTHRSNGQNKSQVRQRNGIKKPEARSRVTNGRELLPDVDHRTRWIRRFADVLSLHLQQLGGESEVSHAEAAIARRASCLIVECEAMERTFALAGSATAEQLDKYQRAANTLRRLCESLGLKRRARDITPRLSDYIQEAAE